jgi:hypothetical protein
MQPTAPSLLVAVRVMAILAALAGLAAGLLSVVLGAFLICLDGCPSREAYFSNIGPGTVRLLTPCVVLAALSLALFLTYSLATRQNWRALIVFLIFLVGGLLGAAALNALMQYGRATLPIDDFGFLIKDSALAWAQWLGVSLLLAAVVWSGGLACLEWGRRWDRLDQRSNC